MHTRESLISQLRKIGLNSGDLIMLHASMRAIGHVIGGPDQVHQAIMETISNNGTLMMYIACEKEYEAIGRGKLSSEEENFLLEHCPPFDPNTARARRDHGILAEFFRSWPGVKCSNHVGARVATLGKKCDFINANHPLNFGYGPGSPFEKIYQHNGKILLLGPDLDAITILHYAEHISPIENKRIEQYKVPLLKNGIRVWIDIKEYDTSEGICLWPDRFFEKILQRYFNEHSTQPKKIGNADSYLIDAKSLVDFSIPIMVEEANRISRT